MSKRKPTRPHRGAPAPQDAPRRRLEGAGRRPGGGQWLYGWHPVIAALANPRRTCRRLAATGGARERLEATVADSRHAGALAVEVLERDALDALLPAGAVHQGVALLAEPLPDVDLADVCAEPRDHGRDVVVVLDQPSDPHNVGAVLRSAGAFGARAVVVPDRHAPEATPAMAKAASGAIDRVPLVRVINLARALADLKNWGYWCIGLEAGAETPLWRADLSGRVVLVLGSEGAGLRRLTRENCDVLASMPLAAGADSLNLSAAAAIALYEATRERA